MTAVLAIHLLSQASLALDCAQTLEIRHVPKSGYETNPILGTRPSDARVLTYFAVATSANAVAYHALPDWARVATSIGIIALEAPMIGRNFKFGLTLGW